MRKNAYIIIAIVCFCFMTSCKKKAEESITLNPITSISPEVCYNHITISWDAPSGNPTGYKIYKNDEFVESITGTVYKDTVYEIGTYHYCVSVVYAEGESERTCIIAEVNVIPTEDYALQVVGDYLGSISIPMTSETFENKNISLSHHSVNHITVIMNDSISTSGITVPLVLNEVVPITFNEASLDFHFSFEKPATFVIMGQEVAVTICATGIIKDEEQTELTLDIIVKTAFGDIPGTFIGYRQ